MNFTFTWILDKFGFQAKPTFEITKTVAPKATTVAKKVARKTAKIPKATTCKTPKK
jgi:hypothetical protein